MPSGPRSSSGTRTLVVDEDTLRRIVREEVEAALGLLHGTKPLIDKATAAGLLDVSVRTLERIVAAGDLAVVRVGGQVRFAPSAVDAYARAGAESARRPGRRSRRR